MDLTIIGAGAMGLALAKGLRREHNIEFLVRDISKYEQLRDEYIINSIDGFDISERAIILAVKPYGLSSVASKVDW